MDLLMCLSAAFSIIEVQIMMHDVYWNFSCNQGGESHSFKSCKRHNLPKPIVYLIICCSLVVSYII